MTTNHIPKVYVEPLGTPLYWMNDETGTMQAAMKPFLEGQPLSNEQFQLLKEYLTYVIDAPCWRAPDPILPELRAQIRAATTAQDIHAWLDACLERAAIDPI